jgi:hypothetical protein
MNAVTEPVTIIGYGKWDDDQPKFGEWVRVKADADAETRKYSLAREINGTRPAEGELRLLELHSRMKATAYNDAEGRAQSGTKEAWRVTGFRAA